MKDVYVKPFPFSAVCPICGSTRSRANELYRHQQGPKCKRVAREIGLAEQSDCQDVVLVVVKDWLSSESLAGDDLLGLEVCFEFKRKNS